ncbi:MAG: GNAT family N-acetyltransferase [Bacillota bacterium]
MIRVVKNEDYDKVLKLSEYAFQILEADYDIEEAIKSRLDKQYILGDFEEDDLKAKLHIYSLEVMIKNQSFKMGGVASVATWPEARRNQKVAKLINEGLHWMNEQEYDISYLHPFYVPFYRKFGWELICSNKTYTIQKEDFIFLHSNSGKMIRKTKEKALPTLMSLYHTFTEKNNSMLIRGKSWWTDIVLKKGDHVILHVNEENVEDGYMIYSIKDHTFIVHEVIVLNESIKKEFWNFVCQHDSMVSIVKWKTYEGDPLSLFLPNPRVQTEIHPYFMGRIVNVNRFLEKYPFFIKGEKPLILHLSDPICNWNNGIFFIEGESIKVFQKEKGACLHPPKKGLRMDIGTLTSVLLGHSAPKLLFEIGHIQGEEQQLNLLEELIATTSTSLLFDFF